MCTHTHSHTQSTVCSRGNRIGEEYERPSTLVGGINTRFWDTTLCEDVKIARECIPATHDRADIMGPVGSISHKYLPSPRQLDFFFQSSASGTIPSKLLDGWMDESISGCYRCPENFFNGEFSIWHYNALLFIHAKSQMS